ncbi:MAG: hypothetical protein R3E42_15965 [Burkholderiaceae bacterium]
MDAGEWASMVSDNVAHLLLETLSDGGQRTLRAAATHQRQEAELRARHGDEVVDDLIRIRAWLAEQPNPDLLLTLLRNGLVTLLHWIESHVRIHERHCRQWPQRAR